MRLKNFFLFLAILIFLHGIFNFIKLIIYKKGYDMFKDDYESFLDFIIANYDLSKIKFIKRIQLFFYKTFKKFCIFTSLFGMINIFFSIFLLIVIYLVEHSDYKNYLYFKF